MDNFFIKIKRNIPLNDYEVKVEFSMYYEKKVAQLKAFYINE